MKLMELADKWLKRKDCPFSKDTPKEVVAEDIEDSYNKGTDLLDPEMFWKEDLIAFAEENKITNDPMMKDFINRAYVSA